MVIIIILFTCGNLFNVILDDFLSWFTWLSYKWWLISIIHLPIETTNQSRRSSPADSLSETTSRSQARSFGGSTSNCVQPYNTCVMSRGAADHATEGEGGPLGCAQRQHPTAFVLSSINPLPALNIDTWTCTHTTSYYISCYWSRASGVQSFSCLCRDPDGGCGAGLLYMILSVA